MNDMLGDINISERATSENRRGDTYNLPAAEATTLLQTTGLSRFESDTAVTYVGRVDSGLNGSVSIHAQASAAIAESAVVRDVGHAPVIAAPRSHSA
jgi:hypothetical protein